MRVLVLAAIAGCHGDAPSVQSAPPAIVHAPHSHVIRLVAVTDAGDAALSADDGNELRFWPSLDGKHEPVVIPGAAGRQIALGRAPDGFVAALLDASGGAVVLALSADGAVRGRHPLAVEPPCDEVRVVGGRVLVRRRDQAIEWRDAAGALRGRLAAPYGERLLALASRRDRVLAAFDDAALGETTHARWIDLGLEGPSWGAEVTFPRAVVPPIGISPNGKRLVAMQPNGLAALIDLGANDVRSLDTQPGGAIANGTAAGFLDDDHAVFGAGTHIGFWSTKTEPAQPSGAHELGLGDPAVVPDSLVERDVGDGVIVSGRGPVLELRTWSTTRYLGYRVVGSGVFVSAHGDRALVSSGTKLVTVDRTLQSQRLLALDDLTALVVPPVALDDHHVAYAATHDGDVLVGVLDLAAPHAHVFAPETLLARYTSVGGLVWAPDAQVLAVLGDRELHRFAIDPRTSHHRELPVLPYPGGDVAALDPAHANGLSAIIAYPFIAGKTRLFSYKEDGARMPATVQDIDYHVVHIDRTGTAYAASVTKLVAVRGGHDIWKTVARREIETGAPSGDRAWFAYIGGGEVTVIDHAGNERWHAPVWKARAVTWLDGDRTLLVTSDGGLLALDAATGERLAAGCGWGFGLYEQPPAEQDFATANVCQEPV